MPSTPKVLVLALIAAAALTACKRDAEPAPEPAPAATAETAPAEQPPAAAMAESGVQPASNAPAWYDAKAFPGVFTTTDASVDLKADGTYASKTRAQSAGADLESAGTWQLEPDGANILLDPDSKEETDRRFMLLSADQIRDEVSGQTFTRTVDR